MSSIHYVAMALLFLLGILCTLAVFHFMYRDNLAERIGLSIVGAYSFLEIEHLILHPHPVLPEIIILYVGLDVFAVGLAITKMPRHCRAEPR